MGTAFSARRLEEQPTAGNATPAKAQVYVIPFSHLDRFWAGTGEECLARGNRIIAKAIEIAKQHREFRFFLETDNFADNFVQSHLGTPELDDFKRLVKEGRIEIAPQWAGIFQEFPPGEALARNLFYGIRYARDEFGVNPDVDQLADLPGFSPQFPQLLREAGIPYMVMTRMGPRDNSLFDWQAPDGSKVLVWNDLYGYCWGAQLDSQDITSAEKRQKLEAQIEHVQATAPGPLYMSSGCDLWAPTADLISNLDALNEQLPGAHFIIATPQDFFARVANTSGLKTLKGEIPSGWPNIETSILHLWSLAAPATEALVNAEKFAAINYALGYAPYPQSAFDFLWKRLITSMDHNHDGQGGAIGDNRKKEYSQLAILRGGEIMRDMTRNIAERVQIPIPKSFPIVVFNPTGWTRDDIVKTHVTLYGDVVPGRIAEYKKALRLEDEKGNDVPFQVLEYSENVSRALELIFVARGVPSLGYKTYYLAPAEQPETFPAASEVTLDQEKDLQEPRRPLGSDVMENDFYRVTVDRATGGVTVFDKALNRDVTKDMEIAAEEERGGNNVTPELLTGRTIYASVNDVKLEENNPVRTVLRIDEQMDNTPIVQRLILYKQLKRLDIVNSVEWKRDRLLHIQQLIPLEQAEAEFHYGVAFGENAASNVIPGAKPSANDEVQKSLWEKVREVHGWLFAGSSDWGVTVAADHQIFELDPQLIRAGMIRGQRYTSAKVVRGAEVTSIHYPPPGRYVFRYSLTSAAGDWRASRSYELGKNFNYPLFPVEVVDDVSPKTLPPTHSFCSLESPNIVVSAMKKASRGRGIVLRVYETAGQPAETPVDFLGKRTGFHEVNLLEENAGQGESQTLRLKPYEIKTIELPPAQ